MLSFQKISRWLSFAFDPISVEDWIANREIFGKGEKSSKDDDLLETAYLIEKEKEGDVGAKGVYEKNDLLLVCALGKLPKTAFEVEWTIDKEKSRKAKAIPLGQVVINLRSDSQAKFKVRCQNGFKVAGKNEMVWQGSGKRRIIIEAVVYDN